MKKSNITNIGARTGARNVRVISAGTISSENMNVTKRSLAGSVISDSKSETIPLCGSYPIDQILLRAKAMAAGKSLTDASVMTDAEKRIGLNDVAGNSEYAPAGLGKKRP